VENGERQISAIRMKQWLDVWDDYQYDVGEHRRRPPEHMFLFSMKAAELRQLCDVYKRERDGSNVEGIQRIRDETRTGRIRRYVRYGYPYGDLKPAQRTDDKLNLRKPGWLPTAIVVNILSAGDKRRGKLVKPEHLISIEQDGDRFKLVIPPFERVAESELAPLEVIDGQHRLWAFDSKHTKEPIPDDFELPVVAYNGLDVAWQAYLFWSINVSPKKINPSHAFDLYPLLRTQDWLESVGELPVYREARAQELTEILYSHPKSAWRNRINMLGERGTGAGVSQAAWVRTLSATFLSTGRGVGRPGLFQANLNRDEEPLEWSRSQQAAFLITLWNDVEREVTAGARHWWIRQYGKADDAFKSKNTMLNQDMGVRALLAAANDIFFDNAEEWGLDQWYPERTFGLDADEEEISAMMLDLDNAQFRPRLAELARALMNFDWRSLDGPQVEADQELAVRKRSYRGSGGYASLRRDVLASIAEDQTELSDAARVLLRSEE
jgi:hypothetical protein